MQNLSLNCPELRMMQTEAMQSMVHDLRTPITVIKGYLEMLLSGAMGEIPQEQKRLIQRSAGRLEDLILMTDNMLQSARLQNDQVSLKPEPTDLDGLLQETIDFYGAAFEHRGMRLERSGNTLGLTVQVDVYWLKRVLNNLIWNAYKFTPDNGRVRLGVERSAEGVEISIQDNGSGMADQDLEKIFNKFEQAGSEKDRQRGHGLGLWISKKIMDLHGGQIRAESSLGKGSRFSIILPARVVIDP